MRIFIAFLLLVSTLSVNAQLPVWVPTTPMTFDRSRADTFSLGLLYAEHWKELSHENYTVELNNMKVYQATVRDSLTKIAEPGLENNLPLQKKWNACYQQLYEESQIKISTADAKNPEKVAGLLRKQLDDLERTSSKTLHFARQDTGKTAGVYFYEVKRKVDRAWVYYLQSPKEPNTVILQMVARFTVLSSGWKMNTSPAGGLGGSSASLGLYSVSGDLGRRKLLKRSVQQQVPGKNGIINIAVCVDENGMVSSAEYTLQGSMSSDAELREIAIRMAKGFEFEKMPGKQSCGTIRFTFK